MKEDFQTLLNRINKEDFVDYYNSHNQEETKSYFDIGWTNLHHLIKYWNIKKSPENIHNCRKNVYKSKRDIKLEELVSRVSKEDLFKYYEEENHSFEETIIHFNITRNQFTTLLKYYNLHKSKEAHSQAVKIAKESKYGDANYNNRDKARETCLDKYGVENVSQVSSISKKGVVSRIKKYGTPNNWQKGQQTRISNSGSLKESYRLGKINMEATCVKKYGVRNPILIDSIKEKAHLNFKKSFISKYGAESYWEREDAKRSNGSKESSYNLEFKSLLDDTEIPYEREFYLGGKWYDFKVEDTLIEIDPTPTHNSTWGIFGKSLDKKYHFEKSKLAFDNGYRCIHVWDWDDKSKIINSLIPKKKVYARNCSIKELDKKELEEFLNRYHYQGNCRGQKYNYGLYFNDELIQVMTFGKPRYNRNYEFELLRLCTKFGYYIVGGAEKLFNYFIKSNNPNSIISYCDNSKFKGDIYTKLGFNLKSTSICKHWYNIKTKIHITDNLLRQRGYDQLFDSNYGKGTSNEELMIQDGFVEIYDAGQSTYIWKK